MSDFVKAIPYFAEFAKREGPEALANFFEFIVVNSVEEAEDESVTVNEYGWIVPKQDENEIRPASTTLNGFSEKISPIPLVQTSESLSEDERLYVERLFDKACRVLEPLDSIRLRAIVITKKIIAAQSPFSQVHKRQLAALSFELHDLLSPQSKDNVAVKSHKRDLLAECGLVNLGYSEKPL
ncbi:hypothetical protein [Mannheimia pernigra]|uniref:hypothetical protein n=1 Tax=Mannheimia pernigra TaxID=111844 RepID=UPI00159F51E7|nr:hypothetical protein [Mannheimia pernigra]QLB44688.1 hypothetical protein HV561_08000 [Mannheimia pernigra]